MYAENYVFRTHKKLSLDRAKDIKFVLILVHKTQALTLSHSSLSLQQYTANNNMQN